MVTLAAAGAFCTALGYFVRAGNLVGKRAWELVTRLVKSRLPRQHTTIELTINGQNIVIDLGESIPTSDAAEIVKRAIASIESSDTDRPAGDEET